MTGRSAAGASGPARTTARAGPVIRHSARTDRTRWTGARYYRTLPLPATVSACQVAVPLIAQ